MTTKPLTREAILSAPVNRLNQLLPRLAWWVMTFLASPLILLLVVLIQQTFLASVLASLLPLEALAPYAMPLRIWPAAFLGCSWAYYGVLQMAWLKIYQPTDRSFPNLLKPGTGPLYEYLWSANQTCWFGAVLVVVGGIGWKTSPDAKVTLALGLVTCTLFAVGRLMARYQPMFGYTHTSPEDVRYRQTDPLWNAEPGVPSATQPAPGAAYSMAPHHETHNGAGEGFHAQAQTAADGHDAPVQLRQPRQSFDRIFGMEALKRKLAEPAWAIISPRQPDHEPPANGILLYGEPGNGKTVFAEALAGELGVPFIQLTYGDVSSKWLGEMPRLISSCFAYAKAHAPCVFFIDEIDSFIRSRDLGSNNSEDLKIANTMLTEIVNLREHQVVLVAATNFLDALDAAAIREGRFDFKVEVTPPDEAARLGLMEQGVRRYASTLQIDKLAMRSVAVRWSGFSVSRILAVVKALPAYAQEQGVTAIGFGEWMAALRTVQGSKGRVPAHTKPLKDLILEPATRGALDLILGRLQDIERIEALGGSLPTGILFHGPSGTGKTATARAMAKECGWAFLPVAGPDLLANRDLITKIHAQAKDLRPTLVFIDEADDVLRHRQANIAPDLVNRLLVLMEGTEEKIRDVVFIAATNHPQDIDPALLRAGRFTEKVEFFPPPVNRLVGVLATWMKGRPVAFERGLTASELAALFAGYTMADIEGTLQYAVNRAISRHKPGQAVVVGFGDVYVALDVVGGGSPTAARPLTHDGFCLE